MLCPYCMKKIKDNSTMCIYCGQKIDLKNTTIFEENIQEDNNNIDDNIASSLGLKKYGPYNKWITLVLAIFLGIFGAHKVYEGKYIIAFIYLLTGGFCFIGVIIDILNLIDKPKEYYVYR